MAAPGESPDDGRQPGPYLDWVWVPLHGDAARVSTLALDAGEEFMGFPPLVRGELLARIRRLVDGHVPRGDTTSLTNDLLGMMLQVGKTRYWVVYKVVDLRCVGLLCCTGTERKLTTKQLDEAIDRSKPDTSQVPR